MQPDGKIALTDYLVLAADEDGREYEWFIAPDAPAHDPFADYPVETPDRLDASVFAAPATVAASLAHNLDVRRQKIWACWGTAVQVGWIGDPAHQAECSDHNRDSTGVVHAIDPMVTGARAQAVVDQCLAHPADLQYVIHNGVIWSVSVGWQPRKYLGSDQHTLHVHISGRHGSSHSSSATCTGYNLAAQAVTPIFDICPDLEDDMAVDLSDETISKLAAAITKTWVAQDLGKPGGGDTNGRVMQASLSAGEAIVALLTEISAKLTPAPPA